MLRAIEHFPAGEWPAEEGVAESVELDWEDRCRRRKRIESLGGRPILIDLLRSVAMADKDGLRCECGSWIEVRAKPEQVLMIKSSRPGGLIKIAWHLGNRHTPADLREDMIFIRPDHVLADMARNLGCEVETFVEAFHAERGAYHSH